MDDFGRCVIRTGEESLSPNGGSQFRELKKKIDTALREMLQDAVDDGSIAPVDVKLAAFTLAGALNWPARWHNPNGARSSKEIAQAMVTLLADGFNPRP